jgi:hypothetical protein
MSRAGVLTVAFVLASLAAPSARAAEPWSFSLAGAAYVLPDEDDYVQPTVKADHERLHLEARYKYEDRDAASVFAGANFEVGDTVKLALTPMVGGVFGSTDGIAPGLEADFTAGIFEAYGEGEYVFDVHDSASNFFYMWSEAAVAPTSWLRGGLVAQRTRVRETPRELQRGLLLGFTGNRLSGTVYVFEPGADDYSVVVVVELSF